MVKERNTRMVEITIQEKELFAAANHYTFMLDRKTNCEPHKIKMMERKLNTALERLVTASVEYSKSVKAPPYNI